MEPKATRSEPEVFADLKALTASPGYVHAVAAICVRDNLVVYLNELKAKDLQKFHQPEHLLRTELTTVLGLMCQNSLDFTIPSAADLASYVSRTDSLLKEFHEAIWAPAAAAFSEAFASETVEDLAEGASLREAIFYGTEGAHQFQYRDLVPEKYGHDDAWLVANKGFTSNQARQIARCMCDETSARGADLYNTAAESGIQPETWLSVFEFRAGEVAHRSGVALDVVRAFFQAFTLAGRNAGFKGVGDFNEIAATPLISTGDESVLLINSPLLCEALYESPFYWMFADKVYRPTANAHRGAFTENFAARRLALVFGSGNVYTNVNFLKGKQVVGEADVLVTFGDRVVVVQAKAKKLTLEARKGNDGQLQKDFAAAIQDACDQGWECANFLVAGACRLEDAQGKEIAVPAAIKEVFTLSVVAENYPALAHQARQYLNPQSTDVIMAPLVMDVFLLDVLTEFLFSPLRFLHYLRMRVAVGERLLVNHELTSLAIHLRTNMGPLGDVNMAMLDDSFTMDMDAALLVRREGHAGDRDPPGILTKFKGTPFESVVAQLEEQAIPEAIEFCLLLLSLGEDAVRGFNQAYEALVRKGRSDGRRHDVTFHFGEGQAGVTLHFNAVHDDDAMAHLQAHCEARKYLLRAMRWFGVSIGPDGQIHTAIAKVSPWEQSDDMDKLTAQMGDGRDWRNALHEFARDARKFKVGRNSPCACGSGKKYKKCCLQNGWA
ncbi:SEC-C metal-binding domain-containing protein [Rhodoferax sp. GW822-FHT02A01]|uniref:SEC-C metal-binding domain-containing protein n=1 Tax=Rhodoferax sp. GW822-FHT02A01 TaxID=3141537 RepID=UPI00315DE4B7